MKQSTGTAVPLFALRLGLALLLCACSDKPQDATASLAVSDDVPLATPAVAVEKGVFLKPDLAGYALRNEYDDDGDGDGINETHVRRYIDSKGDTAFSMTTNGQLWAWSLDIIDGDEADISKNYVIRDSDCDGVFDERYSLSAQFHVPRCAAAAKPGGI